jgi:hypothetical protein
MTSMGLMPTNIDDGYRFAQMVARSRIVPVNYQNQPDNCLVAIDLSLRWGVSWLVVMQHVYMVHDRPALDAALCIALVNKSGIFVDPIEYEVEGDDPRKDDYRVRAYAVRKSTGKKLFGPWIDWLLVKGEGWDQKQGSKWKSMPDQMFHYRAAAWFQRRYAPEVAMGMLTTDEAADMPAERRTVESTVTEKGVQGLKDRLTEREESTTETEPTTAHNTSDVVSAEQESPPHRDAETQARIDQQKADLAAAEQKQTTEPPGVDGETASIF